MKLSSRCLSRNIHKPSLYCMIKELHPAYVRIYENQKPRNKFKVLYRLNSKGARWVIRHQFVVNQKRINPRPKKHRSGFVAIVLRLKHPYIKQSTMRIKHTGFKG